MTTRQTIVLGGKVVAIDWHIAHSLALLHTKQYDKSFLQNDRDI